MSSSPTPLREPGRRDAANWILFPIGLWIFSRAALFAISALSMRLVPALGQFANRRQAFLSGYPTLDGFCRWDCGWYVSIAVDGYRDTQEANFWPLFPRAARLLVLATGMPAHFALILVAQLASLLGFVAVYRVFLDWEDEEAARNGLLLFAAYPFAFFQAAAHPESMLVLFTAAAIALARRSDHLGAGALLALGVLARHVAIFALATLSMLQLRERGPRRFVRSPAVLALLLPLLAVLGYALFLQKRFGDPLAFLTARENWGQAAWRSVLDAARGGGDPRYLAYVLCSLIPGVGALLLAKDRRTWPLAAFTLPLMSLFWLTGMDSLGRYSSICWPAFMPLGAWMARRSGVAGPLLVACALLQGLFAFLYMHQYAIA
jgi:hypothetical protein